MNPVIIVLCIIVGAGLVLLLPLRGARSYNHYRPVNRVHEADVVLSRRLLVPGTKGYASYYKLHPEFQSEDDRSRIAPGLLSNSARHFHTATFSAARANFEVVEFLGGLIHNPLPGSVAEKAAQVRDPVKADPDRTARFISTWLKGTGAHSVGFTKLEEYHLYSHKGRGPESGKQIIREHEHAIAITVEMDHRMMQSAPLGTSVMESSEQYLRSGVLALKLAAWIRDLGYEATAHIDGNYEVICPLVAEDAGLGTIGRMGLLMTPHLGPRVRISVVTTSMPVAYSDGAPDRTILHACHLCKKCVAACPAAAIPDGPRKKTDRLERWQINSEKCYHYWTTSGTDCGRCITACPYSHPDNLFHRFIRWGVKNNLLFRRMAIKLDDLIYGRKPAIRPLPNWSDILDKS